MRNPIREEIEKLPCLELPQEEWVGTGWAGVLIKRARVLAILNRYEVVADIVCEEGKLNLEAFGQPFATLMKTSKVGDRIIIFREKGASDDIPD